MVIIHELYYDNIQAVYKLTHAQKRHLTIRFDMRKSFSRFDMLGKRDPNVYHYCGPQVCGVAQW